MLDVHDFNLRLVHEIKEQITKDAERANEIFYLTPGVAKQIMGIQDIHTLAFGCGCLAKSKMDERDFRRTGLSDVPVSVHELNFLFLNLVRDLAKTSRLQAMGMTSIDEICYDLVASSTTSQLIKIASANNAIFEFAVPSVFLAKINMFSGDRSILAKHAATLSRKIPA